MYTAPNLEFQVLCWTRFSTDDARSSRIVNDEYNRRAAAASQVKFSAKSRPSVTNRRAYGKRPADVICLSSCPILGLLDDGSSWNMSDCMLSLPSLGIQGMQGRATTTSGKQRKLLYCGAPVENVIWIHLWLFLDDISWFPKVITSILLPADRLLVWFPSPGCFY